MSAFADRMREATVVLRDEYVEELGPVLDELARSASIRGAELLSFVRLSFDLPMESSDRAAVADAFRKRRVVGDDRMRQLWSTLAALVLVERFDRGPGRRQAPRLVRDSFASAAVEVLANQGRVPVHPDLISYALHWRDTVAEHLRLGARVGDPPVLPELLASELASNGSSPNAEEGAEPAAADPEAIRTALVTHVAALTEWVGRSGGARRILALEEQQDLQWWLQSRHSTEGEANVAAIVCHVCEELAALTRSVPGPPGSEELLDRRLGAQASTTLSRAAIAARATRTIPSSIDDLCVIVNGRAGDDHTEISAREGARELFAELALVRLADEGSR